MPCRTYWDGNGNRKNCNDIENIVFNMEITPNIFCVSSRFVLVPLVQSYSIGNQVNFSDLSVGVVKSIEKWSLPRTYNTDEVFAMACSSLERNLCYSSCWYHLYSNWHNNIHFDFSNTHTVFPVSIYWFWWYLKILILIKNIQQKPYKLPKSNKEIQLIALCFLKMHICFPPPNFRNEENRVSSKQKFAWSNKTDHI